MPDCKWMQDEVCVNADCPMCADYCPVMDVPYVCRFEERDGTKERQTSENTMPRKLYTEHEVACILAEVFGDKCACNFNDNDEWLPENCEVIDSCPEPVGVACWGQYLKWREYRCAEKEG